MAKLLYHLEGVRGRAMWVFDRKCVIATRAGVGSFFTGNVSDGEKTIFYKDVVGIQFKKSGGLIGYLQFETASNQMNNQNSNMFSENTFTFEHNKNGVTNEQMESIYHQVCDMIECIKYGEEYVLPEIPAEPAQLPNTASGEKYCPGCGLRNEDGAKFCAGCGTALG